MTSEIKLVNDVIIYENNFKVIEVFRKIIEDYF